MSYFYCSSCKEAIHEDNAEWKLCCEEVRYPNDNAHPAEYDGPFCPNCGDEMSDYECDHCGKSGNPDDETLIEDEKKWLICSECKSKLIFINHQENAHDIIYNSLISEYGFCDENDTHIYVNELIEEYEKIKDEINKLKTINNISVLFNEIANENKDVDYIGSYKSYKIKYHGIKFFRTNKKTDKGYIYKTAKPFDELEIEIYNE